MYLVAIPVLHHLVLADGPEVMCGLGFAVSRVVTLESDLHDALIVRKDRLVAVTEVETPYFNVLVRRAGDNQFGVLGDIH